MEDLKKLGLIYALQNAVEYDGKANPGSVIGKIMNHDPQFKSQAKEVAMTARKVIETVNSMNPEEQLAELESMAPELLIKEKKEIVKELPPLENGEKGVVMRLAPNPSGPLHIGHTRMAILNDEYVKQYGGKLIVRMEDTNPPTVLPEAYDMIQKDLDWLGVEYHDVVNQSSRFELYYRYAEEILAEGKGYMCDCEPEEWRRLKDNKKECPHRDTEPHVNIKLWKDMLAGKFEPGRISMVVKTDINHPNPAVRDFVAMRIVEEPHPLTGDKYRVYPLYNFSVAVDDYTMGMTHVLRGKDHLNNTLRQEYVYEHLGWKKPVFIHYGWVSIDDTVLSTRQIKAAIQEGKYSGWDDPRLGTVAALARRGIEPGAIRQYWNDVGAKGVDIKFSWENLYAFNKSILLPKTKRYSFVPNPVPIIIEEAGDKEYYGPYHPAYPEEGSKRSRLENKNGKITVFISSEDSEKLQPGVFRLHHFENVRFDGSKISLLDDNIEVNINRTHFINWVPEGSVDVEIHMPDGKAVFGKVQKEISEVESGTVVELKTFGFVRLEKADNKFIGFFTHK